ncbi:hypothetical protein KSF78_0002851 [Schistosoma japonicum]|nr:hypothetical protein KSF78_0002851 [Schistosoma japonicum]
MYEREEQTIRINESVTIGHMHLSGLEEIFSGIFKIFIVQNDRQLQCFRTHIRYFTLRFEQINRIQRHLPIPEKYLYIDEIRRNICEHFWKDIHEISHPLRREAMKFLMAVRKLERIVDSIDRAYSKIPVEH